MPEILTESFCERCGTRYTFESAAPRTARLKGIKVLSRGLKNYVLSDDTSMDEAMAAARSETDREVTSQQLDAFHKTFNFCMSCRQYTCGNCWNEPEGRCLSCAPHLGREVLPAPFPDLDAHGGLRVADATNGTNGSAAPEAPDAAHAAMAWPTSDLMREAEEADAAAAEATAIEPPESIDAAARLAALGGLPSVGDETPEAAPDEPQAIEPPAAELLTFADVISAADAAAPGATPPEPSGPMDGTDVEGRATAAAGQTSDLLRRFRPGQSLDDEIAAFERDQELAAAAAAAAALTPPAVEAEAPQVADEPEVAPEPVAPEPPTAEPEPIAAAAARDDVVEQPTWRIVAPAEPEAPWEPAPTAPSAEPQWPTTPQWPSQRPSSGLPYLGRPGASGGIEALWAESAREVAAGPDPAAKAASGVQPCVSCGLSLSATARFCRRCGTRQG